MDHDSLTISARHEPGYVLLTAAGEMDSFTVARRPRPVPAAPGGDDDDHD